MSGVHGTHALAEIGNLDPRLVLKIAGLSMVQNRIAG
jgi:hypothetical protein